MIGLSRSHEQKYGLHSSVVNHGWYLNSLWDRAIVFTKIWLITDLEPWKHAWASCSQLQSFNPMHELLLGLLKGDKLWFIGTRPGWEWWENECGCLILSYFRREIWFIAMWSYKANLIILVFKDLTATIWTVVNRTTTQFNGFSVPVLPLFDVWTEFPPSSIDNCFDHCLCHSFVLSVITSW